MSMDEMKSTMLRPSRKQKPGEWLQLEKRNFFRSFKLLRANGVMVFLTVLVITIAMAFPASLLVLARNLKELAGDWQRDLQVQVYLQQNITSDQREQIFKTIERNNAVQSYKWIAAEDGIAEFAKASGLSQLIDTLGYNPLPDVVLIKPIGQDPLLLEKLLTDMAAISGVASANFDQKWAHTLGTFFKLVDTFSSVLLQLLIVGLFVLVVVNVNALVSRSAHEIRVIKLIGATDSFVSRPYIYFGLMVGFFGGLGAFSLVVMLLAYVGGLIDELLSGYAVTYQLQTPAWWELLFLLIGPTLLGMFAAMVSCRLAMSKVIPSL